MSKRDFFAAMHSGDEETARQLLKDKRVAPNDRDPGPQLTVRTALSLPEEGEVGTNGATNGLSALHVALRLGHVNLARDLIEQGADVSQRQQGLEPIHLARSAESVALLASNGANVNAKIGGRRSLGDLAAGSTALHIASMSGSREMVDALLAHGANPNVFNRDGLLPTHLAATRDAASYQALVKAGARDEVKNAQGIPPSKLYAQAFGGHEVSELVAPPHQPLDGFTHTLGGELSTTAGDYFFIEAGPAGDARLGFLPHEGSLDGALQFRNRAEFEEHLLQQAPAVRAAARAFLEQSAKLQSQASRPSPTVQQTVPDEPENAILPISVPEPGPVAISGADVSTGNAPAAPAAVEKEDEPVPGEEVNAILPAPGLPIGRSSSNTTEDSISRADASPAPQTPPASSEDVGVAKTDAKANLRTLLAGRFVLGENGEYRRLGEDRVALVDEPAKIRFIDKQMDTFQAAVELAKHREWQAILVTGTEKFRSEAWYHASVAGLKVVGYEPNEQDQANLKAALERTAESKSRPTDQAAPAHSTDLSESKRDANDFALKRVGGTQVINTHIGRYAGKILHETDHHVVQDVGRKVAVVHEKSRFDSQELARAVRTGESVRVQYAHGKANVESEKTRARGRSH